MDGPNLLSENICEQMSKQGKSVNSDPMAI